MKLKMMLVAALFAMPLATRAEEPQKLTFDPTGWIVLGSFANMGQFDGRELPRFEFSNDKTIDQRSSGMLARQSRLRAALGIPTDGFLSGAVLKGFVEADFMGGTPSDVSTTIPRMRHYYVTATWKDLSNLSLLVGQTWGVAPGPYFASSLTHLAVPRFGGAGFLYRRAPQVRLSAEVPAGPVGVAVTAAALTPGDTGSAQSGSTGNDSGFPNLEGRIAAIFRQGGKPMADVGVWTHYGREKYEFPAPAPAKDDIVKSSAVGVDVKFDLPFVTVLGGAFRGQNLDVLASIAGLKATGTPSTTGTVADTTNKKQLGIKTEGMWGQVIVTPVKGFQLLGGAGFENPNDKTMALTGGTVAPDTIMRNTQYSGGAILNLTSKWRVSAEFTRYVTEVVDTTSPAKHHFNTGNQIEFGSLFAL